jgi:hypothetical protein
MEELEVNVCDVCYLLDGDERLKPGSYCHRCNAFICELCAPQTFRRFHAMLKRKLRSIIYTTSIIIALCTISHAQTPPPVAQFEIPCPVGPNGPSAPLPPSGWSLDPVTGKYRAWTCIDPIGNIVSPGSIVGILKQTNITANSSGTLVANAQPGMYSISFYIVCTFGGTGSLNSLNIAYVDDSGANFYLPLQGLQMGISLTSNLGTLSLPAIITVQVASVSNITYSYVKTAGTAVYSVYIVVTKLL